MRVAFVVADVSAQLPTYGTTFLASAALRRGHDARFVGVNDLTLTSDNRVVATTVCPTLQSFEPTGLCAKLADEHAPEAEEDLATFDVVFLRYHPLREGPGPTSPVIDFGWRLRLSGVLVVNDPVGAQRAAGRMYLSGLPAEIRPRSLITREPAKVKAFLRTLDAPAVVKPLAEKNDGVDSTFYVARGQVKNLNQIITAVRKTGYLVVEEYLREAAQGEKRLLLMAGEPIREGKHVAIYRRLPSEEGPPQHGDTQGRKRGGESTHKRCELSACDQRIVDLLRAKLVSDGLYFVGVDIVGSKVLELNVFTPGGIHANQTLYGFDVAEVMVRDLERRVEVRRAYKKTLERVA